MAPNDEESKKQNNSKIPPAPPPPPQNFRINSVGVAQEQKSSGKVATPEILKEQRKKIDGKKENKTIENNSNENLGRDKNVEKDAMTNRREMMGYQDDDDDEDYEEESNEEDKENQNEVDKQQKIINPQNIGRKNEAPTPPPPPPTSQSSKKEQTNIKEKNSKTMQSDEGNRQGINQQDLLTQINNIKLRHIETTSQEKIQYEIQENDDDIGIDDITDKLSVREFGEIYKKLDDKDGVIEKVKELIESDKEFYDDESQWKDRDKIEKIVDMYDSYKKDGKIPTIEQLFGGEEKEKPEKVQLADNVSIVREKINDESIPIVKEKVELKPQIAEEIHEQPESIMKNFKDLKNVIEYRENTKDLKHVILKETPIPEHAIEYQKINDESIPIVKEKVELKPQIAEEIHEQPESIMKNFKDLKVEQKSIAQRLKDNKLDREINNKQVEVSDNKEPIKEKDLIKRCDNEIDKAEKIRVGLSIAKEYIKENKANLKDVKNVNVVKENDDWYIQLERNGKNAVERIKVSINNGNFEFKNDKEVEKQNLNILMTTKFSNINDDDKRLEDYKGGIDTIKKIVQGKAVGLSSIVRNREGLLSKDDINKNIEDVKECLKEVRKELVNKESRKKQQLNKEINSIGKLQT